MSNHHIVSQMTGRCRWFFAGLTLLAVPILLGQQKATVRQTRESVSWAMAGYKFIEYYFGKEGHNEIYEGEEVTVTALVSGISATRTGNVVLRLYEDRITVHHADPKNTQLQAVRGFFEEEKRLYRTKPEEYRNFYIKVTVQGRCTNSGRIGRIDLHDAAIIAWYGVVVTRSGRSLNFEITHRHQEQNVPYYQAANLSPERKTFKGSLSRVHVISRQLFITSDRTLCLMDADPLSLATEVWRIRELCRTNVITNPLELTFAGDPGDEFGQRYVETNILAWRATNPLLGLFEIVDNRGEFIVMQPPVGETATDDEAGLAEDAKVDAEDRAIAQAFAIAANNLLAASLDDPKGLRYLAFAEHLLPDHPQLNDWRAKVESRTPLPVLRTEVSDFDLIELINQRMKALSSHHNLRHPVRRRRCAFYFAVARELGVAEDVLQPILLGLQMFDQSTEMADVADLPVPGHGPAISELEQQVSGNDPETVDRLLARAEELARDVGEDPRLTTIINRLTQFQRFWNELLPCPDCQGKGALESPCPACNGTGKLPCRRCQWTGRITERKTCPTCAGTGKTRGGGKCRTCDGEGGSNVTVDCPDCIGTGMIACPDCQGSGKNRQPCQSCQGVGMRRRRDLRQPTAPAADSDDPRPDPE